MDTPGGFFIRSSDNSTVIGVVFMVNSLADYVEVHGLQCDGMGCRACGARQAVKGSIRIADYCDAQRAACEFVGHRQHLTRFGANAELIG